MLRRYWLTAHHTLPTVPPPYRSPLLSQVVACPHPPRLRRRHLHLPPHPLPRLDPRLRLHPSRQRLLRLRVSPCLPALFAFLPSNPADPPCPVPSPSRSQIHPICPRLHPARTRPLPPDPLFLLRRLCPSAHPPHHQPLPPPFALDNHLRIALPALPHSVKLVPAAPERGF